jgi:tetratricopeptide (TPR) repeat protein
MSNKRKKRRAPRMPSGLLEIVHGPMRNTWLAQLSQEARDAMPGLHALMREDPRAAVTELRAWIEREPNAMFFNWLSAALETVGEKSAANDVIRENYRRNPGYLFARVGYATICLHDGDLAGVREALGESLDVRALLGARKRIHVSEAVAFFYIVALYRLETGDRETAEKFYQALEEIAPDDPATKDLRRRLRPRLRDLFSR